MVEILTDNQTDGGCAVRVVTERSEAFFGGEKVDMDIQLERCGHSIEFSGFSDWMGQNERWDVSLKGGGVMSFSDFDGVLHVGHLEVPKDKRGEGRGTILIDILKAVAIEMGYGKISGQFGGGHKSRIFLLENNIPNEDISVPEEGRVVFETSVLDTVMVDIV